MNKDTLLVLKAKMCVISTHPTLNELIYKCNMNTNLAKTRFDTGTKNQRQNSGWLMMWLGPKWV